MNKKIDGYYFLYDNKIDTIFKIYGQWSESKRLIQEIMVNDSIFLPNEIDPTDTFLVDQTKSTSLELIYFQNNLAYLISTSVRDTNKLCNRMDSISKINPDYGRYTICKYFYVNDSTIEFHTSDINDNFFVSYIGIIHSNDITFTFKNSSSIFDYIRNSKRIYYQIDCFKCNSNKK